MKAAYITQTGPPENIHYGELPAPQPGPGQVLVQIGAVSVNPIDTYIRSGAIGMKVPMPYIVGCDLAGTVEAVGPARRVSGRATGSGGRTRGWPAGREPSLNMRPSRPTGSTRHPRE